MFLDTDSFWRDFLDTASFHAFFSLYRRLEAYVLSFSFVYLFTFWDFSCLIASLSNLLRNVGADSLPLLFVTREVPDSKCLRKSDWDFSWSFSPSNQIPEIASWTRLRQPSSNSSFFNDRMTQWFKVWFTGSFVKLTKKEQISNKFI
jgi:hypothetical protein